MTRKDNHSGTGKCGNPGLLTVTWTEPLNRRFLLWSVVLSVVLFSVFKYFYPDPDFISDSFSYIFGAQTHLDVNIWPIGYSKFLCLVHLISHSSTLLVVIQYGLLQLAAGYFFFSFLYLSCPSKKSALIMYFFLFCNPLFLFVANLVNSDALFATLSLVWITEMLWALKRPSWAHILATGAFLFACFTVRNNAYFYPVVTLIMFLSSGTSPGRKVIGVALPLLLIGAFIVFTRQAAFRLTGERTFSLFTGWQIANNTLYGFEGIQIDSSMLKSAELRELNRITQEFFAKAPADLHATLFHGEGNYFITHPESPLKIFFSTHYDLSDDFHVVQSWGKASVVFGQYAKEILQRHPSTYLTGFVTANIKNYFYPPLNNLSQYNRGKNDVWMNAQDWFDWNTPETRVAAKDAGRYVLYIYPVLFFFLQLYMVGSIIMLLRWKNLRNVLVQNCELLIWFCFLTLNFGFTVVAAMNILRYQVCPMVICFTAALVVTEALDNRNAVEMIKKKVAKLSLGNEPFPNI